MSPPKEKIPEYEVIATYKCQRRTGKMWLFGTRRATYLDMRRMYGVGAKLAPYHSDEEGEESKGADLGKTGEGLETEGRSVDVVNSEAVEPLSVAPTPEKNEDGGTSGPAGVVCGKKRGRSGSPVDEAAKGLVNDNPST